MIESKMVELIGLICLVILQALHVYHDHMKFKAHALDIKELKLQQNGAKDKSDAE